MTRRLPHVGLGGEQRSLYGDQSTIGEQGKREREDRLNFMAAALKAVSDRMPRVGLRVDGEATSKLLREAADAVQLEAERLAPRSAAQREDRPRDPIRVQASVGQAIPELTSDA